MQSPFFNSIALTVNIPPGFLLPATKSKWEEFARMDAINEEFLHHYTTTTKAQGILMTLLRMAVFTLLAQSTRWKTKCIREPVTIPLEPFYSNLQQVLKATGDVSSRQGVPESTLPIDLLIAAAMNEFDYLYGYIDPCNFTTAPYEMHEMKESFVKEVLAQGMAKRRPVIKVKNRQGIWERIPLGYHAIVEGFARTVADIGMIDKVINEPRLIGEFADISTSRQMLTQNIPHYLTHNFVRSQIENAESMTSVIVISACDISLLYSEAVQHLEIPLLFRDISPNPA